MTRRLVLTNEAARHPFRRLFPPPRPLIEAAPRATSDVRFFMTALLGGFVAFYGFLA